MEKHFKPRQSAQLLWDNITLTALQSHSQSNSFPDKILHFTIRFSSLNFSNLPMINSEQRFENLLARSLHALLCQELLSDFSPFKISNGMSRLLFCSNFPEQSCSLSLSLSHPLSARFSHAELHEKHFWGAVAIIDQR